MESEIEVTVGDLRGATLYTTTLDYTTRGLAQSIKLPEHLDTGLYLHQTHKASKGRASGWWWSVWLVTFITGRIPSGVRWSR
ncbi:MAG: hypothetical protein AAFQ98_13585 [Bacteroidota bacterium]